MAPGPNSGIVRWILRVTQIHKDVFCLTVIGRVALPFKPKNHPRVDNDRYRHVNGNVNEADFRSDSPASSGSRENLYEHCKFSGCYTMVEIFRILIAFRGLL